MRHVDSLLRNDREITSHTTTVTNGSLNKHVSTAKEEDNNIGSHVSYAVRAQML
jgi:hypothetical protein